MSLRSLLLATATALAVCLPAVAEPIVVPAEAFVEPSIAAQLAAKCQPDCIVLSREDWAALMKRVQEALAKNKSTI